MNETLVIYTFSLAALLATLPRIKRRLELSRAKHRSLAGHSRMAKRVARMIPFYEYDADTFFCADGAPADIAQRRQAGFMALAALYRERFAQASGFRLQASDLRK